MGSGDDRNRASTMTVFPIHARTVTGLEEVLAKELSALGATKIEPRNRVVVCQGDLAVLYRANLWCRTAIRILKLLQSFPAANEKAIYDGVQKVDWSQWVNSTGTLAVAADTWSSFTTHSLFLSQLVKDAVVDQIRERTGTRPSVDLDRPDLRIVLSLFENEAFVFLDSSGESLHKRGYRQKAGEAPVSETLAAGIIKLIEWDGVSPLLDPMCGAGTFCTEAGLIAKNFAPGLLGREYAFQSWPDYDKVLWHRLLSEARNSVRVSTTSIVGMERDPSVAEIARQNARRAGVDDLVQIRIGDFFKERVELEPGTLVMNPPYDERLPVDNIASLFQNIGDRLKNAYAGWKACILAGNLDAIRFIGLRTFRRTVLYNGSIECRLLEYELRAPKSGSLPAWRSEPTDNPKWLEKAKVFGNRLEKNMKHFSKWARREGVTCWRIYDWDIPELAFIVDLYEDRLHFAEIERNYDHSPVEHPRYIELMLKTASDSLAVPRDKIYFKKRKPQKTGGFKYSQHAETGEYLEVSEGGHKFLVNLSDYLDVGLFIDHRKTRGLVEKEAKGVDFLNLFAYTGSFTVYAAAGGAKSTTTVDTSQTYLEWAEKNLKLNGYSGGLHSFVRSDVFEFLQRTRKSFDLCVVDPPTRSVNSSSGRNFEVQRDHVLLLKAVCQRMRPGGVIFFSTNFRTFELNSKALTDSGVQFEEITKQTLPVDFQRKPSHRCWKFKLPVYQPKT